MLPHCLACDGVTLSVCSGSPVSQTAEDALAGDDPDGLDSVRHAETPELAREALCDSVALIFKGQVRAPAAQAPLQLLAASSRP